MAATGGDEDGIVGINVTPLVDVVLVLLVILMITASYVASQTIPIELPRGATGESVTVVLTVTIDRAGQAYLSGERIGDAALRERIRQVREGDADVRAVIAADGLTSHASVVRVVDLLRQERVTKLALAVEPTAR